MVVVLISMTSCHVPQGCPQDMNAPTANVSVCSAPTCSTSSSLITECDLLQAQHAAELNHAGQSIPAPDHSIPPASLKGMHQASSGYSPAADHTIQQPKTRNHVSSSESAEQPDVRHHMSSSASAQASQLQKLQNPVLQQASSSSDLLYNSSHAGIVPSQNLHLPPGGASGIVATQDAVVRPQDAGRLLYKPVRSTQGRHSSDHVAAVQLPKQELGSSSCLEEHVHIRLDAQQGVSSDAARQG